MFVYAKGVDIFFGTYFKLILRSAFSITRKSHDLDASCKYLKVEIHVYLRPGNVRKIGYIVIYNNEVNQEDHNYV